LKDFPTNCIVWVGVIYMTSGCYLLLQHGLERGLGREASEVFPFRRGFSVATVCVFTPGISWAKNNTNEQCNDTIMMEEIRKDLGSQFWNVSHNLVVFFVLGTFCYFKNHTNNFFL